MSDIRFVKNSWYDVPNTLQHYQINPATRLIKSGNRIISPQSDGNGGQVYRVNLADRGIVRFTYEDIEKLTWPDGLPPETDLRIFEPEPQPAAITPTEPVATDPTGVEPVPTVVEGVSPTVEVVESVPEAVPEVVQPVELIPEPQPEPAVVQQPEPQQADTQAVDVPGEQANVEVVKEDTQVTAAEDSIPPLASVGNQDAEQPTEAVTRQTEAAQPTAPEPMLAVEPEAAPTPTETVASVAADEGSVPSGDVGPTESEESGSNGVGEVPAVAEPAREPETGSFAEAAQIEAETPVTVSEPEAPAVVAQDAPESSISVVDDTLIVPQPEAPTEQPEAIPEVAVETPTAKPKQLSLAESSLLVKDRLAAGSTEEQIAAEFGVDVGAIHALASM